MRRSEATRPSTASRLSVSRGSSRGIKESVNVGRLSTSGAPLRSNRTPRGAAIGRIRIRFRSEASRKRPPSSTWRYQSWRADRSEEHTSELQSPYDLVCRLLLEKKKKKSER